MKCTDELEELKKLVWYTMQVEEKAIHEYLGDEVRYYVAGSFATHIHNKKYPYNDIDVFVVDHDSEFIPKVDSNSSYKVCKSYKVTLKKKNGCTCEKYSNSKLHVNVVYVIWCSGLRHLLNFFDINCCQIGYEMDMSSGTLSESVCTKNYLDFLQKKVLKVVTFETPATSLLRLYKKSFQLLLPMKLSPLLLMKLKRNQENGKVVNKGLFSQVRSLLEINNSLDVFDKNFDFDILYPSEESMNEDFYEQGEVGEFSASMSFLIKNGCGVALTFKGNIENQIHFSCINGDNDEFRNFKTLIDEIGVVNAFERDELDLSCIDYLLSNESQSAIHTNTFFITRMIEEIKY